MSPRIGIKDLLAYTLPGILTLLLYLPLLKLQLDIEVVILLGLVLGYLLFPIYTYIGKILLKMFPFGRELTKRNAKTCEYDLNQLYYILGESKIEGAQNMLAYYNFYISTSVILLITLLLGIIYIVFNGICSKVLFYSIEVYAWALCLLSILFTYLSYKRGISFLGGYIEFLEYAIQRESIPKRGGNR